MKKKKLLMIKTQEIQKDKILKNNKDKLMNQFKIKMEKIKVMISKEAEANEIIYKECVT
jgi:hypothetical protein